MITHYGGFSQVYFVAGGSEAIEASLKLARQYFLEKGKSEKKYFIARKQSYHGNTLGALSIGGNLWRRKPFDPILIEGHHILLVMNIVISIKMRASSNMDNE